MKKAQDYRWSRQHFAPSDNQQKIVEWMRGVNDERRRREEILQDIRDDFAAMVVGNNLVDMMRVLDRRSNR